MAVDGITDAHARLAAIVERAATLCIIADQPDEPPRARPELERLNQVIDAQEPLRDEGNAAPLAEPVPDSIPMTGEEDPIVEVDDPEFMQIVAEFMRSERDTKAAHGVSGRTPLARALLPFADGPCEAAALHEAIAQPFAAFADTIATAPPHAADRLLIDTLADMVGRCTHRSS